MERCTHCEAEVHRDEICYVGDQPVCRSCAETETLVCSRCGERIWENDNYGDEDTVLCSSCYEDHYVRCARCGRVVPYAAVYYTNEDEDEETPYCEQCYSEYKDVIHCYSYKPVPQFCGEGPLYMGVELEADDGGKSAANARKLLAVFNRDCAYGYIKSDGSLDDGLELVTHPCTLSEHRNKVPWEKVLQKFRALGYMSHQSRTCGLHVHVNRTAFGRTEQQQEEKIGHVLYLFERFWQEMLRFSRRTQSQVEQWAARYGYKETGREILEDAKNSYKGRYTCINLTNRNTIEFRIFRGTLKYNTLIATLQFVEKLCSVAIVLSEEELQALSWSDLMLGIQDSRYPELVQYLKERRLYVNEPVAAEGEV